MRCKAIPLLSWIFHFGGRRNNPTLSGLELTVRLRSMPKPLSRVKPSWVMGIDFGEVYTDISN